MKIITYRTRADGTAVPAGLTDSPRLTFEVWKHINGGGFADLPTGWVSPPAGFSLWRNMHGEFLAIRSETA